MKLAQLLAKLEAIKTTHGDTIEVVIQDRRAEYVDDISDAFVVDTDDEEYAESEWPDWAGKVFVIVDAG